VQVVILILVILGIVGSSAAWRRSPLCSHKTALKLVGAFLSIVGVIAGGTVANEKFVPASRRAKTARSPF
jgi:hypothetical protein